MLVVAMDEARTGGNTSAAHQPVLNFTPCHHPRPANAQAAATTALLQLAEGGDSPYRLQPGERLLCAPGASPTSQPNACVLASS